MLVPQNIIALFLNLLQMYRCLAIIILTLSIIIPVSFINSYAQNETSTPSIDATSLYNDKIMILGNNVKNFVIIIPDEAHESLNQPKNQLPLTNQPYLPQHLVTNVGTTVVWFSADVGHKHAINLNDDKTNKVFEASFFPSNDASSPLTLNNTGDYSYFEKGANKAVPSFVMNGTISVVNLPSELKSNSTSSQNQITAGSYMIPAIMLDNYTSEFEKRGFTVDSHFTYKDLRGGQKGTGPEQTLITWTTPETDLDKVISALKEITPTLPYS